MQSWTILLAYPGTQELHRYPFPISVWRMLLWVVALGLLLFQVGEELYEVILGKFKRKVSLAEGVMKSLLSYSEPLISRNHSS